MLVQHTCRHFWHRLELEILLQIQTDSMDVPTFLPQLLSVASCAAPHLRQLEICLPHCIQPAVHSLAFFTRIHTLKLEYLRFPAYAADKFRIESFQGLRSLKVDHLLILIPFDDPPYQNIWVHAFRACCDFKSADAPLSRSQIIISSI